MNTLYRTPHSAVGDLNNDGKLDLAVIEEPGTGSDEVAILLGDGDGTFAVSSTISLSSNSITTAETTADFNGDGNLDLALTDYSVTTVTILLGSSNGSFTASSSPATGSGTQQVVAADFNRDEKIDLATVNGTTIFVLLGNGDGTFTAGATLSYSGTTNTTSLIAVGDFDGDGWIDLAALAQIGVYPSETMRSPYSWAMATEPLRRERLSPRIPVPGEQNQRRLVPAILTVTGRRTWCTTTPRGGGVSQQRRRDVYRGWRSHRFQSNLSRLEFTGGTGL